MPNVLKTIKVMFSCDKCGLVKAECEVRARREGEPIDYWMERVMSRAVGERHQILSFGCTAKSVQDLMIPINKEHGIGYYVTPESVDKAQDLIEAKQSSSYQDQEDMIKKRAQDDNTL